MSDASSDDVHATLMALDVIAIGAPELTEEQFRATFVERWEKSPRQDVAKRMLTTERTHDLIRKHFEARRNGTYQPEPARFPKPYKTCPCCGGVLG